MNTSFRTLIECMNHYLLEKGLVIQTIHDPGTVTIMVGRDKKAIHQVTGKNMQNAYEELFEWIIDKSDIQNR